MWLYELLAQINYGPLPKPGADADRLDTIVAFVFGLTGALALLFIVIGGFRYIVSRGDPSAVGQAKNTIIFALVGLVVTIVAFGIVTFVINNI